MLVPLNSFDGHSTTQLDCPKLKHCLSEYFFVDSSLFTKIMSYIKLAQNRVIVKIKIPLFAFLLCDEWCDGVPKHLDLALAPNKTNERVNN